MVEREVHPVLVVPHEGRPEACRHDPVDIALATRIKACVEVISTGLEAIDHHSLDQVCVEGMPQTVVIQSGVDVEVGNLTQGVNTPISTARTMHGNQGIEEGSEGSLYGRLD